VAVTAMRDVRGAGASARRISPVADHPDSPTSPPAADRAFYWRLPCTPGVEFFRASFQRHAYVRHTHDTYAVGAIEDGTQTFWCRGAQRITPRHGMPCVNPDEVHDGRSFTTSGYRYRMLYVEPEHFAAVVREAAPRHSGSVWFREPMLESPELARRFVALHHAAQAAAGSTPCPLEVQSRLIDFLVGLAAHNADTRPVAAQIPRDRGRVARAVEFMRSALAEKIALAAIAAAVDLSPFHFLRMFRKEMGMPPHAYLCQLRVAAGRRLLLAGVPPAKVALRIGFTDQSHFSHRFRRTYGVSPGAYLRSAAG
jgi:AraC-like DNA-binding protein